MKRIIITTLIASFIFMVTMIVMLLFETFEVESERRLIRMRWLNIYSQLGAIATSIHLCYLIHNYGFEWATL